MILTLKKTKIIIFKVGQKEENSKFHIMNSEIEIVESFSYLGVKLTTNGNFGIAIKDLKDKGMRAFFKINSILRSQKVSQPELSLKFFDTMVKPILTYGCQVWAQDLPQFDLNAKLIKYQLKNFKINNVSLFLV